MTVNQKIKCNTSTKKRLLVMAGGTGGHIFPALAVAKELQKQNWDIFWVGTADRMEAQIVPQYGIPIEFIQISGLRGKGFKTLVQAPWAIMRAITQAKKIIQKIQPHAVLGMGGYVSGPTGIASWLCGVPVVLHEQNAIAGLTNRGLAKIARRILQAFPTAFPNAEVVGNPVRETFWQQPLPAERYQHFQNNPSDKLKILVAGGSQGAKVINQTLPAFAENFADAITIHHQAGANNLQEVESLYAQHKVTDVKITEFIDDMASALAWADLVICRSGALTVSEIAAVGVPAIFIPFPHKDRQQFLNAEYLAKAGTSIIIEQANFNAESLTSAFKQMRESNLLERAEIAKSLANPHSAKLVAEAIVEVAN